MNKEDYQKIVKRISPKENKFENFLISFFVGGVVGLLCEFFVIFLFKTFTFSLDDCYSICAIMVIFVGSLLTAMGVFDKIVSKAKCGLIVPTTGFAHSITSSALDYKKDGLISGLGSNFFKLAGSVILYGILSSCVFLFIKVILWTV